MEKHGANNMKKINQLFILPLLALSLFNVNNTQSNNSYLQLEETTNDANIIGVRKETTSTSNEEVKVSKTLKVQASSEENGKRSLRFVAGISSLSLNAHFHRDEIKVNDVIMKAKDIDVTCAYSKILNGSQEQTASEVFENNEYKYFVAYTLKDIPEEYWSTVINVSLVVGNSNQVVTKKANVDAFNTNDTSIYSFNKIEENSVVTGYDVAPNSDFEKNKDKLVNAIFPKYYYENVSDTDTEFIGKKTNITEIGHKTGRTGVGFGGDLSIGNKYLKSVVIPEGVKTLNFNAFSTCNALETIQLPSTLTKIEDFAFGSCYSLKNVIIPESVTSIGHGAFVSCTSLGTLVFNGNINLGDYTFAAHDENLIIYDRCTTSNKKSSWEFSGQYYIYSKEENKTIPDNTNGYWHYDENGEPKPWIETTKNK